LKWEDEAGICDDPEVRESAKYPVDMRGVDT
jgi:hypothetical protein